MRNQFELLAMVLLSVGFALCTAVKAADDPSEKPLLGSSPNKTSAVSDTAGQWLSAGPVRVKLQDGQLRYFYVGDKEIIRRIYFAVRDGKWATASNTFSAITVEKGDDHFTVKLAANCKMDAVDFNWTGTITGTLDGKITFEATGDPASDFESNRIGLCVLFGVHSLAGQAFETDGAVAKGEFPRLVAPGLVASKFHKLQYTTTSGLNFSCALDGATFDMEDQRNWGDSSWKAYAPLAYSYKKIGKGDVKSETVTISLSGTVDAKATPQEPVHVKLGQPTAGAHIPAIVALPAGKVPEFTEISFNRDRYNSAKAVSWSYIPTTHLQDEDVIMENLPAVTYQAKTVKAINPDCTMHVGPIGLSPAGLKDPRANTQIAAAFAMGMIKYLSLGGVDEASFAVGDGPPAAVLDAVRPYAMHQFIPVETHPELSHHLTTFAGQNEKSVGLFLMNRNVHECHVEIDGLTAKQAHVLHVASGASEQNVEVSNGTLKVELAPHEVVRVTLLK